MNHELRPVQFHQALSGLPYPATKDEIVAYVRNHTPDNAIFDRITEIKDATYRHETEILRALDAFDPHSVAGEEVSYSQITVPFNYRTNETELVIAAGRQGARIYTIDEDLMHLAAAFKVPNYRYSDREGHFKVRASGGVVRSGVPREYKRESIDRQFLKELNTYLRRLNPDEYATVYVFIPAYVKNDLLDVFPDPLREKIVWVAERNHFDTHPRELLEHIHEHLAARSRLDEPQEFKYF